jgi:hypothetical protein
MSLSLDKLYVKHWVRKNATNVKEFMKDKKIAKLDIVMYYVNIEDSIHYNAIKTSSYLIYKEYITSAEQKEHSVEKFKNLKENWDLEKMDKINIQFEFGLPSITDGVHRLSLYKHSTNKNTISSKYLNIIYPQSIVDKISNALKATTQTVHYNGWSNSRLIHGYHSFNIYNICFTGQRNPIERLDIMRKHYNFEDKYVLDLGCNTGGMLFHLTEIKKGFGADFDQKCIDACNLIKENMLIYEHLSFGKYDLNTDDISQIFKDEKPDIVFLLSLGSWIKNWPALYSLVLKNTKTIILETNNSQEGKAQLDLFEKANCKLELISSSSNDDVTKNYGRQAYIITVPSST